MINLSFSGIKVNNILKVDCSDLWKRVMSNPNEDIYLYSSYSQDFNVMFWFKDIRG